MPKVPSGKGENRFAYNGEYKDRKLAIDVIRFCWLTSFLYWFDMFCFWCLFIIIYVCYLLFWNLRFLHTEWKEMTNNCSIGSIGEEFGFFNSKNTKVWISNSWYCYYFSVTIIISNHTWNQTLYNPATQHDSVLLQRVGSPCGISQQEAKKEVEKQVPLWQTNTNCWKLAKNEHARYE